MQRLATAAIRGMTLDDIPAVLEIDQLSFPIPWPERSYRYELSDNPAGNLLVAEAPWMGAPRVIGYLGYWLIADELHISTLAVHPQFRRRGIAERLLRTVMTQASREGAASATLEVRVSNLAALGLYRKLGYQIVGRRERYYHDNGEDAILMTLHQLWRWRAASNTGSQATYESGG